MSYKPLSFFDYLWPLSPKLARRLAIIAERREAAGKIGDENAPQTQGAEIDPRRLPDVQTP